MTERTETWIYIGADPFENEPVFNVTLSDGNAAEGTIGYPRYSYFILFRRESSSGWPIAIDLAPKREPYGSWCGDFAYVPSILLSLDEERALSALKLANCDVDVDLPTFTIGFAYGWGRIRWKDMYEQSPQLIRHVQPMEQLPIVRNVANSRIALKRHLFGACRSCNSPLRNDSTHRSLDAGPFDIPKSAWIGSE